MITIGIDPHKRSLTAAALDPTSRVLGLLRVPVTGQASAQLIAWAAIWPSGAGRSRAPQGWAARSPRC